MRSLPLILLFLLCAASSAFGASGAPYVLAWPNGDVPGVNRFTNWNFALGTGNLFSGLLTGSFNYTNMDPFTISNVYNTPTAPINFIAPIDICDGNGRMIMLDFGDSTAEFADSPVQRLSTKFLMRYGFGGFIMQAGDGAGSGILTSPDDLGQGFVWPVLANNCTVVNGQNNPSMFWGPSYLLMGLTGTAMWTNNFVYGVPTPAGPSPLAGQWQGMTKIGIWYEATNGLGTFSVLTSTNGSPFGTALNVNCTQTAGLPAQTALQIITLSSVPTTNWYQFMITNTGGVTYIPQVGIWNAFGGYIHYKISAGGWHFDRFFHPDALLPGQPGYVAVPQSAEALETNLFLFTAPDLSLISEVSGASDDGTSGANTPYANLSYQWCDLSSNLFKFNNSAVSTWITQAPAPTNSGGAWIFRPWAIENTFQTNQTGHDWVYFTGANISGERWAQLFGFNSFFGYPHWSTPGGEYVANQILRGLNSFSYAQKNYRGLSFIGSGGTLTNTATDSAVYLFTNNTFVHRGKLYSFPNSTTACMQEIQQNIQPVVARDGGQGLDVVLANNSDYTFTTPIWITNSMTVKGGGKALSGFTYRGATNLFTSNAVVTTPGLCGLFNTALDNGSGVNYNGSVPFHNFVFQDFYIRASTNMYCWLFTGTNNNCTVQRVGFYGPQVLGPLTAFNSLANLGQAGFYATNTTLNCVNGGWFYTYSEFVQESCLGYELANAWQYPANTTLRVQGNWAFYIGRLAGTYTNGYSKQIPLGLGCSYLLGPSQPVEGAFINNQVESVNFMYVLQGCSGATIQLYGEDQSVASQCAVADFGASIVTIIEGNSPQSQVIYAPLTNAANGFYPDIGNTTSSNNYIAIASGVSVHAYNQGSGGTSDQEQDGPILVSQRNAYAGGGLIERQFFQPVQANYFNGLSNIITSTTNQFYFSGTNPVPATATSTNAVQWIPVILPSGFKGAIPIMAR